MRTVSIFTDGNSQTILIPKDMEFSNTCELEIISEGNTLICVRHTLTGYLTLDLKLKYRMIVDCIPNPQSAEYVHEVGGQAMIGWLHVWLRSTF